MGGLIFIMETFDCKAMNTELKVLVANEDKSYAKSAVNDCFADVEMLESDMSMYRFGSDIYMVNAAKVGDIVKLAEPTSKCLERAFQACAVTGGAVDVCCGEFFLNFKKDRTLQYSKTPRRGAFEFDPENMMLRKTSEGAIDLGSIGKGFAVDEISKKLDDIWEIENYFITFGASSIYARGKPDNGDFWFARLDEGLSVRLDKLSIASSGDSPAGEHIMDCRTCTPPKQKRFRTWALCKSCAMADALATAFSVLELEAVEKICAEYEVLAAIKADENSPVEFVGKSFADLIIRS